MVGPSWRGRLAARFGALRHRNFRLYVIGQIVSKPYLTEMDLLRIQKALLLARMSADSTFLVDKKEPGYSSKLDGDGDGVACE